MNYRMFEANKICAKGNILSYEEYKSIPRPLLPEYREHAIAEGEKYVSKPVDPVPLSLYMNFVRTGDRSEYEALYFGRRQELHALAFAEAYEGSGRFLDAIADRIWAICDEFSWVVPAHAHQSSCHGEDPFPFVWDPASYRYIDLFAAATGADLALTLFLLGDRLDALSPEICRRAEYELDRRIVRPFLYREDFWWMGEGLTKVNNWNPWILSNVLAVTAFCVKDTAARERLVAKAIRHAEHFTAVYHDDGGCDEGPSYWGEAGAALFDIAELIYDLSGGRLNVFGDPLLRAIGEYLPRVHLYDDWYLNFADAPPRIPLNGKHVARYGAECGSLLMESFGASRSRSGELPLAHTNPYRALSSFTLPMPRHESPLPEKRVWFDGLKVMILRETQEKKGLCLAVKGGHNKESHNHNDVGSFAVYADGEPLLVDAGSDSYTAATFDANLRYTLWQNRSCYHNLPTLGGCEQLPGESYRSEEETAEENALSLSLKNAYPAECGIVDYRRRAALEDGEARITDALSFQAPTKVEFHFLSAVKPECGRGEVRLGSRALLYPDALSVKAEEIPLSSVMALRWDRPSLWRITLTAEGVKDGTFLFRVK